MQDSPLNIIIKNYYKEILRYCNMKLRNHHAAEDCTQEIFLLFVKKSGTIDFSKDIRPWLYAAADRIMKNYLRKSKNHFLHRKTHRGEKERQIYLSLKKLFSSLLHKSILRTLIAFSELALYL